MFNHSHSQPRSPVPVRTIPRPTQDSSRQSRRALPVIYFDLPVDDHKIDPHRILMRLFECRAINNGLRIEDRDVGKVAFA